MLKTWLSKGGIDMYKVGEKAEFSKTISESDVYSFAGISGDMNPIHIDEIAAQNSFAGHRIVHGALLNGFISTVIGMKLPGPGTIYMEQCSQFVKPVYINDTVKAVVEIIEIINGQKGILKLDTKVFNQYDDEVVRGHAIIKAPEKGE